MRARFLSFTLLSLLLASIAGAERSRNGLLALYDFSDSSGELVRDRSGVGQPLDLKITKASAVRRAQGALEVHQATRIQSNGPATKITQAVRTSGEVTIEAWIRPANTTQEGPARIVTLSKDHNERSFTLGQEAGVYDLRLRTSKSTKNGQPSLSSPENSLRTELTHVVYTRARDGKIRLYLDGRPVAEHTVAGDLSAWKDEYRLALADELAGQRAWLGTYYLVALYQRALSSDEVVANSKAGVNAKIIPLAKVDPKPVAPKPVPKPAPVVKKPEAPKASGEARGSRGLLALYDFREAQGELVRDRSGLGKPLNLRITDPKAVRRSAGALQITGKAMIRSEGPATKIIDAIRKSGQLSVEAWVQPANTKQNGPARMVTISKDSTNRNLTLGQEGGNYDVRLRAASTSSNGLPSLEAPGVAIRPTHLVYTRNRSGQARLFVDGRPRGNKTFPGALSGWDRSYQLALGDELAGDRQWSGTFHLVALYDRDLTAKEIERHFRAGPGAKSGPVELTKAERAHVFEIKIAPLISRHCLECHDASTRKGGLDLAHKAAAFKGGEEGVAIVPGKSAQSLLWQSVLKDEMPKKRTALNKDEKKLLKEWIDGGAYWSAEFIDPAVYEKTRAAETFVQRLTVPEYIETVRGTVGVDLAEEARRILPPDLRADGFRNTAYNLGVDLKHVGAYARLAEIAVSRMDVVAFAGRFGKSRRLIDKDMRGLIERMGEWVLRGPLESDEVNIYRGISTTVAGTGGDFEEAITYILESMLQSPRFIYRIESQQGYLSSHELASRLSYIVWGGPPDEELMRLAKSRELEREDVLRSQLQRLLDDNRAIKQSARFINDWLNLPRLATLQPNPKHFPKWNAALATDMRDETLKFFVEVAWKNNRPLSELMNAQLTYATPRLAAHYGLKPQGGSARYDLSKIPARGGLLTQGSVLTIGGDEASMVTRGLFVLHDVLRGVVKDPPPGLDVTPVPAKPGLSRRAIAEKRVADRSCGGCHSRFEPLAYGLERYDGIGAWSRKDEHGNVLREDGEVLFPGDAKPMAFSSSAQLMDLLAGSARVKEALSWKVAQFALGRPLDAGDRLDMEKVHAEATKGGGTYRSVITAIVMSDLVRKSRSLDY